MRYKFYHSVPSTFKKVEGKTYIAIVGGRNVDSLAFVEREFMKAVEKLEVDIENVVIVSGGARGVDSFAREIANRHDLDLVEILPLWNKFGKRAGFLRNTAIINLADAVVAVPDEKSRGTWHSVELARDQKKRLFLKIYKK